MYPCSGWFLLLNDLIFFLTVLKPQDFLRSGQEQCRVYRAKSYVGAVIPRNWLKSTGYQLDFTVCKPHSCTKRSAVTFGTASNYEKPRLLPINSQNHVIMRTLLHGPYSENIGNIYELVDWNRTAIEVLFYDVSYGNSTFVIFNWRIQKSIDFCLKGNFDVL